MPRIPNIRPTNIYWLFDMRPETLVQHPSGRPFYCGKTIGSAGVRLREHRRDAKNKNPKRSVSMWLTNCGPDVRIQTMEIVPITGDWRERERHWIRTIRVLFPGGANVSDGGEGTPGAVQSPESRARMSAARKGRKFSPEHRARISAANRGRINSPEARAKISASRKGKPTTTGRQHSVETRAKMRAAKLGGKHTPEHRAKMTATRRENICKVQTHALRAE